MPDGRAVARARAASMTPTFASRHVGSIAAHSRPESRRSGDTGARRSAFLSTIRTLGRVP
ncbi:hypothetical protein Acsp06_26960 [Actinomycetospora sp. NBRC 106375]|nr:hypothetical protein Acsp06_26960 [Actinomycetospora sp. NBRC 106375]